MYHSFSLLLGTKLNKGTMHKLDIKNGDEFGWFSIIREMPPKTDNSGYSKRMFLCRCRCGKEEERSLPDLRNGQNHKCKKCMSDRVAKIRYVDPLTIIGNKFGRLLVLKEDSPMIQNNQNIRMFLCVCDCGNVTRVRLTLLNNGMTQSCGCYKKEREIEGATTHGLSNHALYSVYCNMKARCYNVNTHHYHRYGGRGIKICKEWLSDFTLFYNWSIENGWNKGLQIDRIKNNESYSPSNCRWTTPVVQSNNRNDNIRYSFEGNLLTIPEICRLLNIPNKASLIRSRMYRKSMKLKDALIYNHDYRTK